MNLFLFFFIIGVGYVFIGVLILVRDVSGGLGGGLLEKYKMLMYLNGLLLIVGLIIGLGIFLLLS